MKRGMKKLFILSLCICTVMGQTVYAQGEAAGEPGTTEAYEQKEEGSESIQESTQTVEKDNKMNTVESDEKVQSGSGTQARADGVEINAANFPDENFRDYVSKQFDTDGDGSLSADEISAAVEINVYFKDIASLEGVGYFTSLNILQCCGNQLKNLDVSKNTKLTFLECSSNELKNLDVSKNVELSVLSCAENSLSSLDVSKNIKLTSLECSSNQLKSLDVSKNIELTSLVCAYQSLTSLEVSKNTKLELLSLPGNQLTSLDVSKNTNLDSLLCSANQLKNLDVSKNTDLKYLYCNDNQLTNLDVSRNIALVQIICSDNQIMDLDISKNVNLQWLQCEQNRLTSLDVRNCTKLEKLHVRPLTKSKVQYTKEPAEFLYGTETDRDTSEIITNTNPSEVKADISEILSDKIFKAFNIDPDKVKAEIVVTQKEAEKKNKEYLTNLANQSGDTVLKVYDVVMDLYVDGKHKGNITDDFGNLKLTFFVGTEYAGQKVVVYQLHGDEVIRHKNKVVKKDGTVTITVPKLSTFAVALQDSDGTIMKNTAGNHIINRSPQTGDSANIVFWSVSAVFAMAVFLMSATKVKKRKS